MTRILVFSYLLPIYYLCLLIRSPIFTKKRKEISKTEQRVESEEERNVEIEIAFEMKGTKQTPIFKILKYLVGDDYTIIDRQIKVKHVQVKENAN
ncbi:hypothetical protein PHJA_000811700 [Phtheirospermum japonicum]|uniref:Protein TIC 214 n=1 Tax=Phtheirospermum japonicum TaxID=374723 RepID=A0A830BMC1_9LAMI|nr:hypothetical protein PHJA_000811700 [Phtheirospermum japonicum]